MIINNLRVLDQEGPVNIRVAGETIASLSSSDTDSGELRIDANGALAFPGLINSHDHLDFNCFSPLGNRRWNNYRDWGNDIHREYKPGIAAVLAIPKELRTQWGLYKNLLAGVTTVVNHGSPLRLSGTVINAHEPVQNLHSVGFQKNWKWLLNNPLKIHQPCVIHTGEGSDALAREEIDQLLRWNLLRRPLIGIHGVAMNSRQAKQFAGLAWCPESNRVLLDKHAAIDQLQEHTNIVFGTDSTLSTRWNIWEHLRLARGLRLVTDQQIFRMVNTNAAKLWGLNTGELKAGKEADIVVASQVTPCLDGWFSLNPENLVLVICRGKVVLFDEDAVQLRNTTMVNAAFSRVYTGTKRKRVFGQLPALMESIRKYLPDFSFPVRGVQNQKLQQDA